MKAFLAGGLFAIALSAAAVLIFTTADISGPAAVGNTSVHLSE